MVRKNRKTNRRNARSRGNGIPGATFTTQYSGQVAPNSTIAFGLATAVQSTEWRVISIRAEMMAEKPTSVQLSIRGEGAEEYMPGPLRLVSQARTVQTVRQRRSEGWWKPDGSSSHVGWLTNNGAAPVSYVCTAKYRSQTNVATVDRNVVEVFPP